MNDNKLDLNNLKSNINAVDGNLLGALADQANSLIAEDRSKSYYTKIINAALEAASKGSYELRISYEGFPYLYNNFTSVEHKLLVKNLTAMLAEKNLKLEYIDGGRDEGDYYRIRWNTNVSS